jgi:hypothetical protein
MIILAAVLSAALHQTPAPSNSVERAADHYHAPATCSIRVVGYRFEGRRGQEFRYGRTTYTIPNTGYVELLAARTVRNYVVAGQKHRLPNEGSLDVFGMRTVKLPAAPVQQASR